MQLNQNKCKATYLLFPRNAMTRQSSLFYLVLFLNGLGSVASTSIPVLYNVHYYIDNDLVEGDSAFCQPQETLLTEAVYKTHI